jgi:hypothetical protein
MSLYNEAYQEPKHSWACPRKDCNYFTIAQTGEGLRIWRELHEHRHKMEERNAAFSAAHRGTPAVVTEIQPKTPEQYEILLLTTEDERWLKSRGVKITPAKATQEFYVRLEA